MSSPPQGPASPKSPKSPKPAKSPEPKSPEAKGKDAASPTPAPSSPPGPPAPFVPPPVAPEVAEALASLMSADHWRERPMYARDLENDADSAWGSDKASTTASLSESILNYREINGRTYHSERGTANYWGANDERASELLDMHHQLQMMCTRNKLYLAPLSKDIKKILDVGTGTGIWAMDMGDEFPGAEVIGTDISPIQPSWVPPNVKFEIEDCTQDWTFADNTFDYVHIRYLVGSVVDWEHLFREAYRVCKPGGWVESAEGLSHPKSSDHTVKPGMAVWDWSKFFIAYGKMIGRTFEIVNTGLQDKCIRKAGFVDVDEWNFRIPLGPWPKDPKLCEIGRFAYATFGPDLEGFISLPARELLGWGEVETAIFCAHMRREMMSREVHWAFDWKNVWGRKPLH